VNVEEHTQRGIDVCPLYDRPVAPSPHPASVRRRSLRRKTAAPAVSGRLGVMADARQLNVSSGPS
jgi:hypothetical protein